MTATRSGASRPGRGTKGDRHAVVPDAEFRSYYGRPVLKPPVWTWEVPAYFFAGGMAGAAAALAAAAEALGDGDLAKAARRVAGAAAAVSPALLISDLGRPARFFNMLRVFKPTSPLSMGSWTLAVFAPAAVVGWLLGDRRRWNPIRRLATAVAGGLGPVMATYTAVLVADTAVPAWHEARTTLPFVFAGGATASAGAGVVLLLSPSSAERARRLAVGGAGLEMAAARVMHRQLGELDEAYQSGPARIPTKAAEVLVAAGAAVLAFAGRRSAPATLGGALVLAGTTCQRWAVFLAGRSSAADPAATVRPQRSRASSRV